MINSSELANIISNRMFLIFMAMHVFSLFLDNKGKTIQFEFACGLSIGKLILGA